MSNYLDDDDDLTRRRNERELTLSTGSILGIFFGLALICALFFGFGYNMGRRSGPSVSASSAPEAAYDDASLSPTSSAKPSAGSFAATPPSSVPATDRSADRNATIAPDRPASGKPSDVVSSSTKPAEPAPARATATPTRTDSTSSSPGSFVVQVAAVSHQEDADLLVSALHRKGYSVAARNEPGDKLVHIQVGPFSDHKEADAMRARLLSDGYNAMIKQL